MITIDSLEFKPENCMLLESSLHERVWQQEQFKDTITLHFFDKEPDLPCKLSELSGLRNAYREGISSAGGGIISVDLVNINGLDGVETIFKLPQEGHGMSYLGAITFPFAQLSYVISIQCLEIGMTGMREAIVISKLMNSSQVSIDAESGQIISWSQDPYEPSFKGPALANKAEAPEYDLEFPDHPLSRLRRLLAETKTRLQPDAELLAQEIF